MLPEVEYCPRLLVDQQDRRKEVPGPDDLQHARPLGIRHTTGVVHVECIDEQMFRDRIVARVEVPRLAMSYNRKLWNGVMKKAA